MSSKRARSRNPSKTSLDSDVLFKITQYLRKHHRIPFSQILIEPTIKFTRDGPKVLGRLRRLKVAFIRNVRTPDIVVVDGKNKPVLIIEQDGHTHNAPDAVEKDAARNAQYDRASIRYIILNTQKIKAAGMTPGQYLDKKMKEINLHLGKNSRHLSDPDVSDSDER